MSEKKDAATGDDSTQNVPNKIINTFIELLSKDDGYKDISERLHSELFSKSKISEPAIKAALFGDESS